jgi:predicted lysophospholipase L1 biosynthesis ABC-type transport system permease subunit
MAELSTEIAAPQSWKRRMLEYGVIGVLAAIVAAVSSPVVGYHLTALLTALAW